jgi:CO/xanthine dehydrogenase Mo-binding subunit
MEDNSLVDGRMLTVNLGEFKMATIADVPKLTTVLMEDANGPIPYHGKAIAEIPNVPTAAAIANAIEDAVGVRLYDLPITSEKIYAALNNRK